MSITVATGCWTLTDPYGDLALWEANCHTVTREEADAYRDKALDSDDDNPAEYEPQQTTSRCYTLTCDTCGTPYERGAHYGCSHHVELDATHDGWLLYSGRWACPNCKK